ncbi:MAG: hypothetical protein DRI56_04845 [Chloroflexota bacterium]|nr:MAG: hypothetical protein DRI56_04845 [Chloroflexota bacterium]
MPNLERLIERWRAGDEKAAEALYNIHQIKVYRLSFGLLGNKEDAEEAAQEALTYALLHIQDFDARRSKFTTWLHMITVSRCRDLFRKKRLPTLSFSAWFNRNRVPSPPEFSPEQRAMQSEKRDMIWEAVLELSPALREAIVLRHWGEHTYKEIADIVGCPLRTAQSRVRLAYQYLEKSLDKVAQERFAEEAI